VKCKACQEEFVPSDMEEDLCSKCEYEMEKGTEKVLLSPGEVAIVLRNNNCIEAYENTSTVETDAETIKRFTIAVAIAHNLQNSQFIEDCLHDFVEDFLLDAEENEDLF
jgi:hypothetical protein